MLVGTFNQEKALVGAFSVIVKTDGSFAGLLWTAGYCGYGVHLGAVEQLSGCDEMSGAQLLGRDILTSRQQSGYQVPIK